LRLPTPCAERDLGRYAEAADRVIASFSADGTAGRAV
jgi:hypothetical protein